MFGRVTKQSRDARTGVITSEDGRRYRFCSADVVNMPASLVGQNADFLVRDGRAVELIVMCGNPFTVFAAAPHVLRPLARVVRPDMQLAA